MFKKKTCKKYVCVHDLTIYIYNYIDNSGHGFENEYKRDGAAFKV